MIALRLASLIAALIGTVPVHGKCYKKPDVNGHVNWPKQKLAIQKNMFKSCKKLKTIHLSPKVVFVDDSAFVKSGLNLVELTAAWREKAAECAERAAELEEKVSERDGQILVLEERNAALEGRIAALEARCGETVPSVSPTLSPTASPTRSPPTDSPTDTPTASRPTLTASPTSSPPTDSPTDTPTASPPTLSPTASPTRSPLTDSPTDTPTAECDTPCTSTALVKILPPANTEKFGRSVAISGDTLVVGDPWSFGAAYVFSRQTS